MNIRGASPRKIISTGDTRATSDVIHCEQIECMKRNLQKLLEALQKLYKAFCEVKRKI